MVSGRPLPEQEAKGMNTESLSSMHKLGQCRKSIKQLKGRNRTSWNVRWLKCELTAVRQAVHRCLLVCQCPVVETKRVVVDPKKMLR